MKQTAVFVTGANGFIGRVVVERLARDYTVYALLRPGTIPGFQLLPHIKIVWGDMTEPESIRAALPARAIVVNLAANPYHPTLSRRVNVDGVRALLDIATTKQVRHFIHISSQATKIARQGVYARTKGEADVLVAQSTFPTTILKPSLVYGPGSRGLFARVGKLMRILPFVPVFGDGETSVYPIHVNDVAEAIVRVVADPSQGHQVYDLGSSRPITYNALYRAIAGTRPVRLVHIPVWLGLWLARAMQFLPHPPISVDNVLGSTQPIVCRSGAIRTRYHLTIRSFHDGMREVETQPRVRVAVVGLGKMGTLHLSLLSHMHDVEIVALVDTNKALFRTVQSMGVTGRFYATLEQALAAETVEAVYLITPTFTHVPLIKQALAAGVHVFVEKPVALHAGEITELARLRTDRIIQVGYTMLYVPVIREVRRILDTGSLGPIISVQASFAHGEVFGPKKGWMFNPALSGGGVLMNPGPHLFSIIAYLFGEPTRITGAIRELYTPGLDDVVEAHFSYPHYTLSAKLSWSVPDKPIGETQLTIRTRRGWIKTNGHEIRLSRDGKRQTIREEALLPDTVFELNPAAYGSAYFAESRAFIEAVQGAKRPVPNTLSKALAIETMIHQLYAARGQRA